VTPKSRSEQRAVRPAKRAKRPKCPICGKPASLAHRPFCSKGCADIDLGRWLSGRYVVPGEPVALEGDEDVEN